MINKLLDKLEKLLMKLGTIPGLGFFEVARRQIVDQRSTIDTARDRAIGHAQAVKAAGKHVVGKDKENESDDKKPDDKKKSADKRKPIEKKGGIKQKLGKKPPPKQRPKTKG